MRSESRQETVQNPTPRKSGKTWKNEEGKNMKIGAERGTVEKKTRFPRFVSGTKFVCQNDDKSIEKILKNQGSIKHYFAKS